MCLLTESNNRKLQYYERQRIYYFVYRKKLLFEKYNINSYFSDYFKKMTDIKKTFSLTIHSILIMNRNRLHKLAHYMISRTQSKIGLNMVYKKSLSSTPRTNFKLLILPLCDCFVNLIIKCLWTFFISWKLAFIIVVFRH